MLLMYEQGLFIYIVIRKITIKLVAVNCKCLHVELSILH